MPQTVDVPGRGVVEFPDDFTPELMGNALRKWTAGGSLEPATSGSGMGPSARPKSYEDAIAPVLSAARPEATQDQIKATQVKADEADSITTAYTGMMSGVDNPTQREALRQAYQLEMNGRGVDVLRDTGNIPQLHIPDAVKGYMVPLPTKLTLDAIFGKKEGEGVSGAMSDAMANVIEGFTTEDTVQLLGMAGLAKKAHRAVSAVFAAWMMERAPDELGEIWDAVKSGDKKRVAKAMTTAIATAGLIFGATKGAIGNKPVTPATILGDAIEKVKPHFVEDYVEPTPTETVVKADEFVTPTKGETPEVAKVVEASKPVLPTATAEAEQVAIPEAKVEPVPTVEETKPIVPEPTTDQLPWMPTELHGTPTERVATAAWNENKAGMEYRRLAKENGRDDPKAVESYAAWRVSPEAQAAFNKWGDAGKQLNQAKQDYLDTHKKTGGYDEAQGHYDSFLTRTQKAAEAMNKSDENAYLAANSAIGDVFSEVREDASKSKPEPVAPPAEAEAVAPTETMSEPVTGKPFTATVYRGVSSKTPNDPGIYSQGTHYTTSKDYADAYGDKRGGKTSQSEVTLKNPFVATPNEMTRLHYNLSPQQVREKLQALGHDGVVILHPDNVAAEKAAGVPDRLLSPYVGKEIITFEKPTASEAATSPEAPKPAETTTAGKVETPPAAAPKGTGEMREGPGAKTEGERKFSAISQLDQQLKARDPVGVRKAVKSGNKLADAITAGKTKAEKALGKLRSITNAIKTVARGVRDIRDIDRIKGDLDWALQRSSAKSLETRHDIKRQFKDEATRDASAIWSDTPGTPEETVAAIKDTLDNLPKKTSGKVMRALQAAMEHRPDSVDLADLEGQFFGIRANDAIEAGVFKRALENYYTHIWGREDNMPDNLRAHLSNGRVNEYFQFSKQRKIPTILEGIRQGMTPIMDPADVLPFYNFEMDRAIASREFVKALEKLDASDGKPALAATGTRQIIEGKSGETVLIRPQAKNQDLAGYLQVEHPALKRWRWADTDAESGKTTLYEGDLYVHPEYYEDIARIMSRDRITPWEGTRKALELSGNVKGMKLGFLSGFHAMHTGSHGGFHWTNPFAAARTPIDWDSKETQFAVQKGHLKIAPNPHELSEFAEGMATQGWAAKIPLIGPWSKAFSEWQFGEYIPRLKMATFRNAYARNIWMRDNMPGFVTGLKGLDDEQVAARVGDSVNNAFGELNQLFLGKHGRDPQMQRALRLVFLAPDFGEARLRFAFKAFTKTGNEERIALATMFLTLYSAARVGNLLSHGNAEAGDWKHAFSIKVGDHWWSMRSVIGDVDHALTDFSSFIGARLNPLYTRTLMDVIYGRDRQGRKLTTEEKMKNLATQVVPIQLSGLTRADQKLWESFVTSMGVQTQRETPQQDVYRLLQQWKEKSADPKIRAEWERSQKEVHAQSDYKPLRDALTIEDSKVALKEYTRLLQTKSAKQIRDAMNPQKSTGDVKPFSNSARIEAQFKSSLSPDDLKTYQRAIDDRKKIYQRFLDIRKESEK